MSDATTRPMMERHPLPYDSVSGIGGWLILPVLHLIANAALIAYFNVWGFLQSIQEEIGRQAPPVETSTGATTGGGMAGTTPHAPAVNVPQAAVQEILPQMLGLALVIFSGFVITYALLCLARFFQKKKHVPAMMIGFYLCLLIMAGANAALLLRFPTLQAKPDDLNEALVGVAQTVVFCAVWIPYFRISRRVKNTFVN